MKLIRHFFARSRQLFANSQRTDAKRPALAAGIRCHACASVVTIDWNAVVNWLTEGVDQETHAARTSLLPKRKLVR